jgi:hypothetical protein
LIERRTRAALPCCLLVACTLNAAAGAMTGMVAGTINSAALTEVSGLAVCRNNPHVLWLHNDSGDRARIFAVNTAGRLPGIYTLPGVTAIDCEDIAIGPGPGKGTSYIYVGDIGDNDAWLTGVCTLKVVRTLTMLKKVSVSRCIATCTSSARPTRRRCSC